MAGSCLALANWPWSRQMANWPAGGAAHTNADQTQRRTLFGLPSHMVSVWLETIKYRKSMKCPALLNAPHFPPPFFWVLVKMKLKKNCIDAINQMVMCQSIIIVCGCLVRLKGVGFRSRDVGVADSL